MGRPKGSKNKPKKVEAPIESPAENTDDAGEVGTPHYEGRRSAIEEIAAQNREERDEELGEETFIDEEEGDYVKKDADEAIETDEEPETEPEKTAEIEAKTEAPDEPVKKKFIVDGEEREFTEDEITAIVQKSAAADRRLEEATKLLKDAQATRTPEPSPAPPPKATSSTEDVEASEELAKELTNAITYGDEEQVAKAVKTLLGEGRRQEFATQTQNMSPDEIRGYVAETIAFQAGTQLLETSPDDGGFSDIWSDPVLKAEFQRREDEKRDNGDNRPYVDLYKDIGNEVREWRENLVKQYLPKTGLEDRANVKRETGVVRGAGSTKTAPTESRPLSAREKHEQALKEAAAARGQT